MACNDSDVSYAVSTVGLIIPFCITDNGFPISNALSASVTWVTQGGQQRPLTLTTPTSAIFTYQVSGRDSRTTHTEQGYLMVSFGTNVYFTSAFTVHVVPHFT
jgi:hypothetical protein